MASLTLDTEIKSNPELAAALATGEYDFLDYGSSGGSSFDLAAKKLGLTKGIGLDLDAEKVAKAQKAGYQVLQQDVTHLEVPPGSVKAVILSHFLEHVPSVSMAGRCIDSAVMAAKDFVYVRQPWFDGNGFLASHGMKMYWADWSGHPNLMTTFDLWRCFRKHINKGRVALAIFGRTPIASTADPRVVEIRAPRNLRRSQLPDYQNKEILDFPFPHFSEMIAVAVKRDRNGELRADWRAIGDALGQTTLLQFFDHPDEASAAPAEAAE